jgi:hypothetical protein
VLKISRTVDGNSEVMGRDGDPELGLEVASDRQYVPVGLGAIFTKHAISAIEVVACATFPQELVQSDSMNLGGRMLPRVWASIMELTGLSPMGFCRDRPARAPAFTTALTLLNIPNFKLTC